MLGPEGGLCSRSLLSPQYGKKKLKYLPYNHQHQYFFLSECRGAPRPRPRAAGCPTRHPFQIRE